MEMEKQMRKCSNCFDGRLLEEFHLVECHIYEDLMFEMDCCPLWRDSDGKN